MEQTKFFNSVLCIISSINPAFQRIYKKKIFKNSYFPTLGTLCNGEETFFGPRNNWVAAFLDQQPTGWRFYGTPKQFIFLHFQYIPLYPTYFHLVWSLSLYFLLFTPYLKLKSNGVETFLGSKNNRAEITHRFFHTKLLISVIIHRG